MSVIDDPATTRLHDPVVSAKGYGDLSDLLWGTPDGVRLVLMRELLRQARGPGHRKKAGYWHGVNSRAIERKLFDLGHRLYLPRAEAALVSSIEDGALEVPLDRQSSVVAMIPADHYVVVADVRTANGSDLLAARFELPPVLDVGRADDVMDRVQRSNAVDVVTVAMWSMESGS